MADEIFPAEFFGIANAPDRRLAIGGLDLPVWSDRVAAYIRRNSSDLSIIEIEIAALDGPEQEELDLLNFEAERYPWVRRSTGGRRWSASTRTAPTATH